MSDDSDNSSHDVAPSNAELEKALRQAVRQIYKAGNLEELTVKRVRKAAEGRLELNEGFFKAHGDWNKKSKDVIQSEVDSQANETAPSQAPQHSDTPDTPLKKQQVTKKPKAPSQGKKRASTEGSGPKKRRKKDELDNVESGSDAEEPKTKRSLPKARKKAQTSSSSLSSAEDEDVGEADRAASALKQGAVSNGDAAANSESEMSVVLDEAPKPKKKRKIAGSEQPKSKKTRGSEQAKATEKPTDPDTEEIKRLQGWLVKCGIRKMWYKELAQYDTAKAKIQHLKEMLTDAGMTGRFSIEKANQIREERELKADLEAVQMGAKQWGKAESEDEATGRPRRRLAKGLKELDFLNDDDGEETD